MPSLLGYLDTMEKLKERLQDVETEEHKSTRARLEDPEDLVPPEKRKIIERNEVFVVSVRERMRITEGLCESGSKRLGSVYASSGLCLS